MFTIAPDPAWHRVVLIMHGDFEHDPRTILLEMKRAVPHVRAEDGWFDFLSDFSKVGLIPRDHSRGGEKVMQWCRENGLRKCACVLVNAAQRMAVERKTENDPRFDFFLNREEAEHWLMRDWPGGGAQVLSSCKDGSSG